MAFDSLGSLLLVRIDAITSKWICRYVSIYEKACKINRREEVPFFFYLKFMSLLDSQNS